MKGVMDRTLLARVHRQAWFHRYPRGLPVIAFLIGCAATVLAVFGIERAENQARQLQLARTATEISSAVQLRAAENVALLSAASALFETGVDVSPQTFAEFVAKVNAAGGYHGSLGLGWARYLNRGAVRGFELSTGDLLGSDFRVRPVPELLANTVVPIVYLHPQTRPNRDAIGFDMYSEATRRDAMDLAIRLNRPVASGKVNLVQDAERPDEAGFLIYVPVFEPQSGNRRMRGFVYSPFNAQRFLASASQLFGNHPVDIALYDRVKAPENLLAQRLSEGRQASEILVPLQVANRQWVLSVAGKAPPFLSALALVTLVFGLVLSLLLMVLARLVTRRAAEDRIVLEWLSSQAAIRDSLTRELNHRVKNTLASVLSIVALTRRRHRDVDSFVASLDGRIRALSATHDLLSQSDWRSAAIRQVVESELAPYMQEDGGISIAGDDFDLAPKDALSLGLALHELATNAAKYGALSVPGGAVAITWQKVADNLLELTWQERGGPPVTEPAKRGFGRDLLERIVAQELQTSVDLRFEPEGLSCRLHVPLRAQPEFALRRRDVLREAASLGPLPSQGC